MSLERDCSPDCEYEVEELWDGPGPGAHYKVTAHLKTLSQDGSEQTKLAAALIKNGVLTREAGFEFRVVDDRVLVVFNAISRASIHVDLPIENAQMILNSYISRALNLASYIEALQTAGRCKIR